MQRKIHRVLALIVLLAGLRSNAQTTVGGPLFGSNVWTTSGSPYHVTSDVLVVNGASLTIEPGVQVLFDAEKGIEVDGILHAQGTSADSIRFDAWDAAATGGVWKGIRFNTLASSYDSLSNTGCLLRYCALENGGVDLSLSSWACVYVDRSAGKWIEHCDLRRCTLPVWLDGPLNVFRDCRVHQLEGSPSSATFLSANTLTAGSLANASRIERCVLEGLGPGGAYLDGPTRFVNNCVTLNAAGWNTYGPQIAAVSVDAAQHVLIRSNGFHDNCGSAITFFNSTDATVSVLDNEFSNNLINLAFVNCNTAAVIEGNDFLDHGTWMAGVFPSLNLVSGGFCAPVPGSYFDLDLSLNYFGGLDSMQMSSAVFDLYDDINSKAVIGFMPLVTQAYGNALAGCVSTGLDCYDSTMAITDPTTRDGAPSLWISSGSSNAIIHYAGLGANAELIACDALGRRVWDQALSGTSGQCALPVDLRSKGLLLLIATGANGKAVIKWVKVD